MSVAAPDPGTVEPASRKRRWFSWLFGVVALSALVGSIWYAYEHGLRRNIDGPPPLIKAEPGPARVKPEEPGGLKVPFQEQTIYKEIGPKAEKAPTPAAERLLPPPEQPLPKPKAPEPVATPAPPPAPSPTTAALPPPPPAPTPAPTPPPAAPTVTAPPPPAPAPAAPPASPVPPVSVTPAAPPPGAPIPLTPPAAPATPPPSVAAAPIPPPLPPLIQPAPSVPAVGKSPPPVAPSAGGIRVQLGAFADQPSAEKAWVRLKSAHADLLANTAPSVTEFVPDGKKPVYRLQAGPFADLGTARNACVELKARKVDCIVRP
jgi:hypothetical protein